MENLKRLLGALCIGAFLVSFSNASWLSDFINKNLDASITSESAGYHKTQASGFLTGGSTRIRWASAGSIRPFSAQAPKLNVGCNGIDFTFGSFSYLSFDQLVKKLEKMSAAAPAFAFQIALSTLCKDCQSILGELENVANAINNMNFDTCSMTTNLAKNIGGALNDRLGDGKEDSWNKGFSDYVSKADSKMKEWSAEVNSGFKSAFGDGTDSPSNIKRTQGSMINAVIQAQQKNSGGSFLNMFGEKNYEIIVRALFGDVIGFNKDGIDDIAAMPATLPAEEFIKNVWRESKDNSTLKFISHTIKCEANEGCSSDNITAKEESISIDSLKVEYGKKLEKIVEEMKMGKVNPSNLKEIEKAPIAVADLLNLVSTGEVELDSHLVDFIALQIFKAYIEDLMYDFDKQLGYVTASKRMKNVGADEKVDSVYSLFNYNRNSIYERINKFLETSADEINKIDMAHNYSLRYTERAFETNALLKKNKM